MEISVKCYGEVADAIGAKRLTRQLDGGATVGDLLESIRADHPTFDPDVLSGRLVAMRERHHLDETEVLADGDTVALSQSPMRE
jgi:molybdopterin converting factor small subunit